MTSERILKELMEKIDKLERERVRFRKGRVTAARPLAVALGGADVPYTNVRKLASATVVAGDHVAVLTWGNDLLVLGTIASG